jgi:acyl-CoA synthetase (AMP-forming)/AMP-acid ligase II
MQAADDRNFGDVIWRAAALYPDKIAIEQGDDCLTYRQLEERARRVAGVLSRLGVRQGARVLLLFPNDFRFVECLLGTLRAGGVVVTANIRLGGDALTFIAAHSEAEVMVVHADLREHVDPIRAQAPRLRHVLVAGGTHPNAASYDDLVAATPPGFASVPVEPERDVALQMYTSGSTGVPKGVLLSHANKWWQARSPARGMQLDERDKAPVAWVVLHDTSSAEENEIKQFFLARGPAYAHPRRVFFLDKLPVSGTNTIDRKSLELEARERIGTSLGAGAEP